MFSPVMISRLKDRPQEGRARCSTPELGGSPGGGNVASMAALSFGHPVYGTNSEVFLPEVLGLTVPPLGFPDGSDSKDLPAMQETWIPSLGQEDSLEKGMATHCSILAWRIP